MILPNAENAFIDDRKLIDYCLSESHPVGKHKVRVFISALGFSIENYQDLKNAILINIQNTADLNVHYYGEDYKGKTIIKGFIESFLINNDLAFWMQKLV